MPKIAFAVLAASLLVAIGAASVSKAPMPLSDLLSRPMPKADRTITYGADPLNIVDLWKPAGKAPFPVVLMIHGGCWQTKVADRSIMNWIADDLRKRGIAVWNIEYRGVDRGGGYPATYDDVAAAGDRLIKDGKALDLDTGKVVVIGHSAGGHLGLWLAARTALPRNASSPVSTMLHPATVISQGGIPDLRAVSALPDHPCGNEGAIAMAGGKQPSYADTSPPEMAQAKTPQILVNGDRDRVAPPEYARDYVAKVTAKGGDAKSIVVPETGHFELIAPESVAWAKQVALIEEALGRKR